MLTTYLIFFAYVAFIGVTVSIKYICNIIFNYFKIIYNNSFFHYNRQELVYYLMEI